MHKHIPISPLKSFLISSQHKTQSIYPSSFSYASSLLHSMALSLNHFFFLTFALTLSIFLSSLTPFSDGIRASSSSSRDEEELRKMVLGSRPPGCVNKCMSCRPCEATLVIPPHQSRMKWKWPNYEELSHREDDSYYLLSWKCRCGNKLYQP